VKRVVIVGRGAAGKSVLAARLSRLTGLPLVVLDERFWRPGLAATPPDEWAAVQRELAGRDEWIMDGDLGPYDVLAVRLEAADTVIVLDFSFARCACRALRRSRERADFWWWLWGYRRRSLPLVMGAIAAYAPGADRRVLKNPRAVRRFTAQVTTQSSDPERSSG
jgi:hypothetical protein